MQPCLQPLDECEKRFELRIAPVGEERGLSLDQFREIVQSAKRDGGGKRPLGTGIMDRTVQPGVLVILRERCERCFEGGKTLQVR